jgi:hypothetical protein
MIGLLILIQRAVSATQCKFQLNSTNTSSGQSLYCHEFSSWFELNSTTCFQNMSANAIVFDLEPSASILLTQELNILQQNQILFADLYVYKLKGINVFPWPATYNQQAENMLSIYLSNIEFYVNEKPQSEFKCNRDLIPDSNSSSIFSSAFTTIYIPQYNNYPSNKPVCPFLLKNAHLSNIYLYGQVDSFLYTQLLRFNQNINHTESIRSNILQSVITGYNYKVDEGMLHPLVFERIGQLTMQNRVLSIETELFKNFQFLNEIYLNLDSVGNFFHTVGIGWMSYLSATNATVYVGSQGKTFIWYYYPDQNIWSKFASSLVTTLPGFLSLFIDVGYFTYILTFSTNFA